jgi:hypothetical protein
MPPPPACCSPLSSPPPAPANVSSRPSAAATALFTGNAPPPLPSPLKLTPPISNKCESELAGVPHVGGAYCELSFGQPLVLKGHVRAHAFGSPTYASASAVASAPPHLSLAAVPSPPRQHLHAAAPSNLLPSTLSLLRRERNKLIQREHVDHRAITRLRTADDFDAQHAKPSSNGLLSARAAVDHLHAQDKAAQHVRWRACVTRRSC